MDTKTLVMSAIDQRANERGYTVVRDYRYGNLGTIWATAGISLDTRGKRLEFSFGQSGDVTFRYAPPGEHLTEFAAFNPVWADHGETTTDWVCLTLAELVERAVDAIAPPLPQTPDGIPPNALCGDCGESIVDGEDPWEWSEDIGDFVHARCIDEPEEETTDIGRKDPTTATSSFEVVPKREGILTVGELKNALMGIPNHVHVCITAAGPDGAVINDGWWNNVADLVPPGMGEDQDGHFTFDLVVGGEFDTRQF